MDPLTPELVGLLAVTGTLAVFGMLWTISVTLQFENGLSDLRAETQRLQRLKDRRARQLRGEEELEGVTFVDEAEALPDDGASDVQEAEIQNAEALQAA